MVGPWISCVFSLASGRTTGPDVLFAGPRSLSVKPDGVATHIEEGRWCTYGGNWVGDDRAVAPIGAPLSRTLHEIESMAILSIMASTSIKSTYSLDVQTVRQLEAMARRWNVSKSEALRRAIRSAAAQEPPEADALMALDDLQASLSLTDEAASEWLNQVNSERRAAGHRTGS